MRCGLLDLSFTSNSSRDGIMGCDWNKHSDVPGLEILDTESRRWSDNRDKFQSAESRNKGEAFGRAFLS